MRRALIALFATALFLPQPADAQLGRLINRARDAAGDAADTRAREAQRTAAASAQGSARAAVPTGPLRLGPSGYVPGVDLLRLLTDFQRPEIPRGVGVVFPGADGTAYTIEVRDTAGAVVQQFGTDIIEPMPGVDYTVARTNRMVGDSPEVPGHYVYTVRANGEVIADVPYSVAVTESDDPMRTEAAVSLDGLWRTHAALRFGTYGRPELRVRLWARNDEMGGGDGAFTVTLERDGRAVSEAVRADRADARPVAGAERLRPPHAGRALDGRPRQPRRRGVPARAPQRRARGEGLRLPDGRGPGGFPRAERARLRAACGLAGTVHRQLGGRGVLGDRRVRVWPAVGVSRAHLVAAELLGGLGLGEDGARLGHERLDVLVRAPRSA